MTTEIQKRESRIDPWTDLDRAFDAMRQRFLDVWGVSPFGAPFFPFEGTAADLYRTPRTDVTDTGTSYKVVAEIPGIPKEKLDIRVRGTSVEIRGESGSAKDEKDTGFVHRERTYTGYYRSLELPEPVVATEAKAKVENGLLELELPKQHPTPSESEVKVAVQ
jgi:HSP20 family protein